MKRIRVSPYNKSEMSQGEMLMSLDPNSINYKNDCMNAIMNDPFSLKYIKNQTKDMVIAAVEQNPLSIKYSNIGSDHDIRMYAIKSNPSSIHVIKRPTSGEIIYAISLDKRLAWKIRSDSPTVAALKSMMGNIEDGGRRSVYVHRGSSF